MQCRLLSRFNGDCHWSRHAIQLEGENSVYYVTVTVMHTTRIVSAGTPSCSAVRYDTLARRRLVAWRQASLRLQLTNKSRTSEMTPVCRVPEILARAPTAKSSPQPVLQCTPTVVIDGVAVRGVLVWLSPFLTKAPTVRLCDPAAVSAMPPTSLSSTSTALRFGRSCDHNFSQRSHSRYCTHVENTRVYRRAARVPVRHPAPGDVGRAPLPLYQPLRDAKVGRRSHRGAP